ncbi:rhodanese-like domain-containing protein [Fibrella forsythiae]|uniref:Rhodanese-like domain-containing protein n=1 Tax=Fibrella forsythiae TaxID=2817061 RepID=A0ABS3JHG2_9BACT|nr:rhodanese-like domain-containing protein [Fibrella forsythiae]MBO0949450.1 rhodanese-like domain-containing protein [Fibrella forsythiae]
MKFAFLSALFATALPAVAQRTISKPFGVMVDALIKESVPVVTCNELKQMPDALLFDAREKREYAVSHLPKARWIGYDDFELSRVAGVPKTAPVVVYCSVGYRSEKVGEKLKAAGFTNVRNLYGSLFEWVNQGNPVVDSTGKPTRRVHAYSRTWGIWLNRGEKVYE